MSERRVGIWLIGALGGVGSTTALGLVALAKKLTPTTGLVTELPQFQGLGLDSLGSFVVGGHDIRNTSFQRSIAELHARSGIFADHLLTECSGALEAWTKNVRPGVVYRPNPIIAAMADRPEVQHAQTPREAIDAIQTELRTFRTQHQLEQVVVINAASTEPPFEQLPEHESLTGLEGLLARNAPGALPTSSLYAFAALDLGLPYINLTPSRGASLPALYELALKRRAPHTGQDLKTGETLLKSVLAPMFLHRNLRVLSWVGHNILGNRDGLVLNDPHNKASKVQSKDALLAELLGYRPQSHVSIEYIESLDDWKTAWDHIHFEGFLGTRMTLQFTWQGCDSILAAPLVIDLARLLLFAQRRGESGVIKPLAAFFKSPLAVSEHDFSKQFNMLSEYLTGHQ